jgi:hypothetical protein
MTNETWTWGWLPGMKAVGRKNAPSAWFRVEEELPRLSGEWAHAQPDWTDAATVAGLHTLVRRKYAAPQALWGGRVEILQERHDEFVVVRPYHDAMGALAYQPLGWGPTEVDALLRALQGTAPVPTNDPRSLLQDIARWARGIGPYTEAVASVIGPAYDPLKRALRRASGDSAPHADQDAALDESWPGAGEAGMFVVGRDGPAKIASDVTPEEAVRHEVKSMRAIIDNACRMLARVGFPVVAPSVSGLVNTSILSDAIARMAVARKDLE